MQKKLYPFANHQPTLYGSTTIEHLSTTDNPRVLIWINLQLFDGPIVL